MHRLLRIAFFVTEPGKNLREVMVDECAVDYGRPRGAGVNFDLPTIGDERHVNFHITIQEPRYGRRG